MTDRLAVILGVILLGVLAADIIMFGSAHIVYLGKKFFQLIEWLAFWR